MFWDGTAEAHAHGPHLAGLARVEDGVAPLNDWGQNCRGAPNDDRIVPIRLLVVHFMAPVPKVVEQ